jgi:hypothetical protein
MGGEVLPFPVAGPVVMVASNRNPRVRSIQAIAAGWCTNVMLLLLLLRYLDTDEVPHRYFVDLLRY